MYLTFTEVLSSNIYKVEVHKLILTYGRSLIHFTYFFSSCTSAYGDDNPNWA